MKYFLLVALLLPGIVGAQELNRPTDAQVRNVARKFMAPAGNKVLSDLVNSARVRAGEVIMVQSCYRSFDASRLLGRYVMPDMTPEFVFASPMYSLQHHDKSQCLDIDRIDNFKTIAKNAISFRTVFVSPSSGESKVLDYTMTRQADGEWLFSQAGR